MAHRASLVHDQPILDAQFAVQLVTVVTFLRISAHFEANLTEQIVSEGLVDLEYCDGISIISDIYFRTCIIRHVVLLANLVSDDLLAGGIVIVVIRSIGVVIARIDQVTGYVTHLGGCVRSGHHFLLTR